VLKYAQLQKIFHKRISRFFYIAEFKKSGQVLSKKQANAYEKKSTRKCKKKYSMPLKKYSMIKKWPKVPQ